MAVISRLQLDHPALGTAGGSALHASIEALYKKIGDNMADRLFYIANLANTAFADCEHNFNTVVGNLRYDLYLWNEGTGELTLLTADTTPAISAFTIAPKTSYEKTILRVTNSSGAERDLVLVVLNDPIELNELTDVDLTTAPDDGQALVYELATKKFKAGASGDASFKIKSITGSDAVLVGGHILFPDGREAATYDGAGSASTDFGKDLTVDLDVILGSNPIPTYCYYLYIDLDSLAAPVTQTDTGRKVCKVEEANLFLSEIPPYQIDRRRYAYLDFIRSNNWTDGVGASNTSVNAGFGFLPNNGTAAVICQGFKPTVTGPVKHVHVLLSTFDFGDGFGYTTGNVRLQIRDLLSNAPGPNIYAESDNIAANSLPKQQSDPQLIQFTFSDWSYLLQSGQQYALVLFFDGVNINVDEHQLRTSVHNANPYADGCFWQQVGGVYLSNDWYFEIEMGDASLGEWTGTGATYGRRPQLTEALGRKVPTIQKKLTGTGVYTFPDGVTYAKVKMAGGGGGGGGSGTTPGTGVNGTKSLFGTYPGSLLHFEGSGATISDEKGAAWTANGSATQSTDRAKFGTKSLKCIASGDYIAANDVNLKIGTRDFTIEFWANGDSIGSDAPLISNLATTYGFEIGWHSGNQVGIYNGNSWIWSGSIINQDTWYHIALTRSGGYRRLFVDGVLLASQADTYDYASTQYQIGRYFDRANAADSYIDEVRLTIGKALWENAFTPPASAYSLESVILEARGGSGAGFTLSAGGSGSITGASGHVVDGSFGDAGNNVLLNSGGRGGSNPLSGAGAGGLGSGTSGGAGNNARSNTGGGGGGAGTGSVAGTTGAGGGGGGYLEAIISAPSGDYPYNVGVNGNGGTAGTNGSAGGHGANGIIIVEEHYT